MNQREFTDLTGLLTAVTNGEIPPYAKAVLEGYIASSDPFIIIVHYLSPTHVMPCSGSGNTGDYNSAWRSVCGLDSMSQVYLDGTNSKKSYTVTKATAYWTD